MRKQGRGLIIYTGSIMGRTVVPFSGPYNATKFATEAMAESLFYELHGSGVDVTILQAGGFPTEILDKIESPGDSDRVDSMQALKERSDGLWQQWFTMLETAAPSPDLIADAMVSLVEAASGQRPLRVVVDPVTGEDASGADLKND
jgi:short-subunit dehydrogenase